MAPMCHGVWSMHTPGPIFEPRGQYSDRGVIEIFGGPKLLSTVRYERPWSSVLGDAAVSITFHPPCMWSSTIIEEIDEN
jgi:hypothetical protein